MENANEELQNINTIFPEDSLIKEEIESQQRLASAASSSHLRPEVPELRVNSPNERSMVQRAAKTSIGIHPNGRTRAKQVSPYIPSKRRNGSVKVPERGTKRTGRRAQRVTEVPSQEVRSSSVISMRDITPEIAAQVVKNYLLPMFDGNKSGHSKTKTRISKNEEIPNEGIFKPKTIYGELKLSDRLSTQLEGVKLELKNTQESLSAKIAENEIMCTTHTRLKKLNKMLSIKNSLYEKQIQSFEIFKATTEKELINSKGKINQLEKMLKENEIKTTNFCQSLQREKVFNEKLKNQLIEHKHSKSLSKMETDILGTRLAILNNSIRSLGTAKEAEERNTVVITELKINLEKKIKDYQNCTKKIADLLSEHKDLYSKLETMNEARKRANIEKSKFIRASKNNINILEQELKQLKEQSSKQKEEIDSLKKSIKVEIEEKNLLLNKINDMKTKRNLNQRKKICYKCNQDFSEKENFRWSCITHQREWSGKMWWCCGSTDHLNPGCVKDYHISKTYNESDKFGSREGEMQQKIRCLCCKQKGHPTQNCPLDPNLRTAHSASEEFERISGLKDIETKKYAKDGIIETKKYLEHIITNKDQNPFKRGVLTFDDYNYTYYNKDILPDMDELMDDETSSVSAMPKSQINEAEGESEEEKDREKQPPIKQPTTGIINKESIEEEDEDPFTLEELKEIQKSQQKDLFNEVLDIKNEARLEFLTLKPLYSLREQIEDNDPPSSNNGKSLLLSNSKKVIEQEIGLGNQNQPKFGNELCVEDVSSAEDSIRRDFDPNLDMSSQFQKVDNSYAHLIKDQIGTENEYTDNDDYNDTQRPLTTNVVENPRKSSVCLPHPYNLSVTKTKEEPAQKLSKRSKTNRHRSGKNIKMVKHITT
ncbi:unnamed protein product [Moneuplotes crassus]|uniref:Uncharacterized protein n=1 Tax=Euplotes crassus TaxID=5936 RepID=A0AAD1Y1L4_EUPCR|nr:unnamed protein product [Moneuplotes crassus]